MMWTDITLNGAARSYPMRWLVDRRLARSATTMMACGSRAGRGSAGRGDRRLLLRTMARVTSHRPFHPHGRDILRGRQAAVRPRPNARRRRKETRLRIVQIVQCPRIVHRLTELPGAASVSPPSAWSGQCLAAAGLERPVSRRRRQSPKRDPSITCAYERT
jgi:hypothetical protein